MVDTVQLVLLIVIVSLTILLVILGVQVFLILRELRRTVTKANRVLDNTSSITESVSRPISSLSSVLGSMGAGTVVAKMVKMGIKVLSHDDDKKKRSEDDE